MRKLTNIKTFNVEKKQTLHNPTSSKALKYVLGNLIKLIILNYRSLSLSVKPSTVFLKEKEKVILRKTELPLQFVSGEIFSYLFMDSAIQMLTVTEFGLYRDSESLAMVMIPLKKGDFYPKTSP